MFINPLLITSQLITIPPLLFLKNMNILEKSIFVIVSMNSFMYHRKLNCKSKRIIQNDRISARFFVIYSILSGFQNKFSQFPLIHVLNSFSAVLLHIINKKHKPEGTNDGSFQKCKYHMLMHTTGILCWYSRMFSQFT